MRSKNVCAFCHCVSSLTVVLWQKVNLTNNHFTFQNKIDVILCENDWRLIWHIIQHAALASSYWTTKNKGYGFYWPALYIAPLRPKTQRRFEDRELNQARSKPDTVNRPVWTARIFVHHYNSRQYCNTETVFIYIFILFIFPFLQTNITSQMWLTARTTVGFSIPLDTL